MHCVMTKISKVMGLFQSKQAVKYTVSQLIWYLYYDEIESIIHVHRCMN